MRDSQNLERKKVRNRRPVAGGFQQLRRISSALGGRVDYGDAPCAGETGNIFIYHLGLPLRRCTRRKGGERQKWNPRAEDFKIKPSQAR